MSHRARRLGEARVEAFLWNQVIPSIPTPSAATIGAEDSPDVQMRLAALERDAFAKGYAQGERAGGEAAVARADGMLKRLSQTVEELVALRGEIIRRTERQTVQLVLAIAERVVQREVTLDRTLLLGMARAALDRLGEYASATIRLHPDDYRAIAVKTQLDEGPVRIVADPVVTRGGCLVQSDFGFMDAAPDSQFRELARALLSDVDAPQDDVDASHGIVLK